MKKIPLHTIIFFYLSLVPVLLFLIVWGICIFQGDPDEIFDAIILICGSALIFLLPVIVWLQTAAIVNYFDARKKVREYKESHPNNENYESIL